MKNRRSISVFCRALRTLCRNVAWRCVQTIHGIVRFQFYWLPYHATGIFIIDPYGAIVLFPLALITGTFYNAISALYYIASGLFIDMKNLFTKKLVKKLTGFQNTPWRNAIIQV